MRPGDEMKLNLFYLSGALFYLASIINFIFGNDTSMGVVGLCLGSAFLCLGSASLKKSKENSEDDEK